MSKSDLGTKPTPLTVQRGLAGRSQVGPSAWFGGTKHTAPTGCTAVAHDGWGLQAVPVDFSVCFNGGLAHSCLKKGNTPQLPVAHHLSLAFYLCLSFLWRWSQMLCDSSQEPESRDLSSFFFPLPPLLNQAWMTQETISEKIHMRLQPQPQLAPRMVCTLCSQ